MYIIVLTSTPVPASVVQVATSKPTYQESVIINTDHVETKQTKKRKAITAANNMNAPVDYTSNTPPNAAVRWPEITCFQYKMNQGYLVEETSTDYKKSCYYTTQYTRIDVQDTSPYYLTTQLSIMENGQYFMTGSGINLFR